MMTFCFQNRTFNMKRNIGWHLILSNNNLLNGKNIGNTLAQGPILIINLLLINMPIINLFISTYKAYILHDHILHP